MTNTMNRRAALGGLVTASALLGGPNHAKAVEASAVSRAYAVYRDTLPFLWRVNKAEEAALARFSPPAEPRFNPARDVGGCIIRQGDDGAKYAVLPTSDKHVADLRARPSAQLYRQDGCINLGRHCAEKIMRTVERIEAFLSELQRRREAAGLIQVDADREAVFARLRDAAEAVLAAEPASLRELAMQADVVLFMGFEDDEPRVLERLIKFAGLVRDANTEA